MKKSTEVVKFSEQTVLCLCSDTETNTFKVNQVAIIDSVTEQIYEKNSRNYPITKVEKLVNSLSLRNYFVSLDSNRY